MAEVEQLRRQLAALSETHGREVTQLRGELEESEAAREQAETQYQTLLGRVEKIKETLGERLKRDKAELEEAKDRIEVLEGQNRELEARAHEGKVETTRLRDELAEQSRECSNLRSRNNLSQQNWLKEKEDTARQLAHLRGELESASTAMGEWEVIAMEERSQRQSLADKVADLQEQIETLRDAYQKTAEERDVQAQAVDGLQRALQEIQEARRKELRDAVETSEQKVHDMEGRVREADSRAVQAEAARKMLSEELERTAPFEKEVREKNLLIGKLRHEAIVLNDHLTKALKYIMKTKPEETIDR
jgi:chromosome segregation ATPase